MTRCTGDLPGGLHGQSPHPYPQAEGTFNGVTASRFLAYIRDILQTRDWEAELG